MLRNSDESSLVVDVKETAASDQELRQLVLTVTTDKPSVIDIKLVSTLHHHSHYIVLLGHISSINCFDNYKYYGNYCYATERLLCCWWGHNSDDLANNWRQ